MQHIRCWDQTIFKLFIHKVSSIVIAIDNIDILTFSTLKHCCGTSFEASH